MSDLTSIEIPCRSNDSLFDVRSKNPNEFCIIEKQTRRNQNNTVVTEVNFMQTTNFSHPAWTSITTQMTEVFTNLHTDAEKNDRDKNLSNICFEASQNYIKIIETELSTLSSTDIQKAELEESFKLILTVWKLCDIIFLKSSPSGGFLLDLQQWYRSTNNLDPIIQNLFVNGNQPEVISSNEDYWPVVIAATGQGRVDVTRHLLSFHVNKNKPIFKIIDDLLRRMPAFNSLSYLTTFEFKAKWEFWQKECLNVLRTEDFSDETQLETICNILCADEQTFLGLKDIFNSWYYMLISWMSYSNPTFNISDLHMQLSTQKFIGQFADDLNVLDNIIFNILDFDVQNVVKKCVELFSNNLLNAHLLDILYLNGKLQLNKESSQRDDILKVYEQNLSDYGTSLLAYSGLWLHGCEYLLKCFQYINGIDIIEAYIEKMPVDNEVDGLRLFNIALKFNLQDQAYSIGRIMQMKLFKTGQYENALNWCIKIKDSSFGIILAEKVMEMFIETNNESLLDLLNNRNDEVIFCDRLAFLCKFRDYLNLFKANKYKECAALIIQLLEAPQLIPMKFRQYVIIQVSNLLSSYKLAEEQIFSLLRIIQNFENRRKIFTDKSAKFETIIDRQSSPQKLSLTSLQAKSDEEVKFNEIYKNLSLQLSDAFTIKSIEIN